MIRDHEWFRELVDQVHKIRGVAIGGILKRYIKEREKENLTQEPGEEEPPLSAEQLFFGWKPEVRKYRKLTSAGRTLANEASGVSGQNHR
jgi:hypothetical protein